MAEPSHFGRHPESNPFIDSSRTSAEDNLDYARSDELTRKQAWCLYLSHTLSMWNSRMYEFTAILFIQAAFPGTLLASSINGIAETICVLLFSSVLGRWVDRAPSRLRTLLLTINVNKCMVLASCLIWFTILSSENTSFKRSLFAIVLFLGMVEKLSRMTNILSMERDWIPTLANPSVEGRGWTPYGLTHLNTTVRRIDMLCKIGAPIAISSFISAISAHRVATVMVAVMSTISWGVECWAATNIWKQNNRLQAPKRRTSEDMEMEDLDIEPKLHDSSTGPLKRRSVLARTIAYTEASFSSHMEGLRYYLRSDVCIPSVCVAILHASVLSYGGTFVTYLLNAGFTLSLVTVARAVGSIFEVASTIVFPYAVARLSSTKGRACDVPEHQMAEVRENLLGNSSDEEAAAIEKEPPQTHTPYFEAGIIKVGLQGICGLFICLIPAMFSLFHLDAVLSPASQDLDAPHSRSPLSTNTLTTLLLLLFLSLSFLGRWTYDLSAMQLSQVLIPATHRSSFGGTEMAVVSVFSMFHWVGAAIWHRQSDFKWLALGSFVAVGFAAGVYWGWQRWWERREEMREERRKGGSGEGRGEGRVQD